MPSEQRLHPASMLFAFADALKKFALPGLLVLLGAGRSGWSPTFGNARLPEGMELWLMLLLIPSGLSAILRYLSFRLRYEPTELVIRSGIVFRNERHVPYHRIQNLDAVQNLFHRLLGVIEVRVETGASKEPEATIRVLPAGAFPDMRRRVFEGRTESEPAMPAAALAPVEQARTLLRLPLRELLLCGFIENRGLILVGAAYGFLWEVGLLGALWDRLFDDGAYTPGMVRGAVRTVAAGNTLPVAQIALIASGFGVLLLLVRLVSMVWALVRLYGFHLSRAGNDLRAEFGLTTHVSTTIPLHRVQTMTIREGLLHRLLSRASLRVETAGGGQTERGSQPVREREWLAPLIRTTDLPQLAREVLPGFDLGALVWRPVHPRAFRRAIKPALVFAGLISSVLLAVLHWRGLIVVPAVLLWTIFATRQYVRHLGWTATGEVVAFRSGWVSRRLTVVPVARIQAVGRMETPFDRRTGMARVRVDTAGAGERSHRVDIPYLARDIAADLHGGLAAAAAGTVLRW
jgi:putative membrane protein